MKDEELFNLCDKKESTEEAKQVVITINEEFKKIIPPLSSEELFQLETNLLRDGCMSPLVLWNGILIDGHNRYSICERNYIEYKTVEKKFNNENEVKEWIIRNQFGRRNLSPYTRAELAIKLNEFTLKTRAKENLSLAGKEKQPLAISPKAENSSGEDLFDVIETFTPVNTRKELSELSGVGLGSIDKVKVIQEKATEEVKEKLKAGTMTINEAFTNIKKVELQEKSSALKKESIEKAKMMKSITNIVCGDSTIETLNAPNNIKCVLTDPPYGQAFISNRRTITAKDTGIANDDTLELALEVTKKVYTNLFSKMADDSCLFSFIGWKQEPSFRTMIEEVGFKIKNSIIWVKNNHGSGDLTGSFSPKHERIIFAVKGNPKLNFRPDDVLNGNEIITEHPTSKPIDLLKVLIEATTNEGDIVVDPFAGHGSTLIISSKLKRSYWGCELDEFNYSQIKINIDKYGKQ